MIRDLKNTVVNGTPPVAGSFRYQYIMGTSKNQFLTPTLILPLTGGVRRG
jgi:hypothetical protein